MIHRIISIIALSLLSAPFAGAQVTFTDCSNSVKPFAEIGFGKAYSTSSDIAGLRTDKSSSNTFGVEYRHRFWKHHNLSLGINAGVGYSIGSMTLKADEISFDYAAGPDADMDGDSYQRYTLLGDMSQKITLSELAVPVYVDINWQLSKRFSLYAEAGMGFRFSSSAKAKDITGTCDVYGIYPKYANLKIDDEWLNDFGNHSLSGATAEKPQQNSFTMNLRAGGGFRVWIYGPVSLECGVNYNIGLTNRLKSESFADGAATAENAPMTYTVDSGRKIKSLTSALNKSKLSNLNLNIGLIFSF